MLRGVMKPNPKKRFLEDLLTMITNWRLNKENCDIILMADMNEFRGEKQALHEVCQRTNLIDSIFLLDLDLHKDPKCRWGSKRIDYILISPTLAEVTVKAGHHNFNQNFISDHKDLYIQFNAGDIFDMAAIDRSHVSYQRLHMGRNDIVQRYIFHLEALYKEHGIWNGAENLAGKVLTAPTENIKNKCFRKFDNLDNERIGYMCAAENFAGSPLPNGV